jgi:hypothetical protein
MKVRIYIKNALTKEIVTDHEVVLFEDYDKELMWKNMQLNHKALSEANPDCHVNFEFLDNQDFIAGVPHNMELDQARIDTGEMSWQRYMKKWHNTDIEYSVMPSSN